MYDDIKAVANLLAGISFLVVPLCITWLFYHRRRDWPKSWVMLLSGSAMGMSGISRLFHSAQYAGYPIRDESVVFLDLATAVLGLFGAAFIPRAVIAISRFPTPRDVEHAIRGNMARHAALAEVERIKTEAEWYRRQRTVLLGIINILPSVPPGLKQQIDDLIAMGNTEGAPNAANSDPGKRA